MLQSHDAPTPWCRGGEASRRHWHRSHDWEASEAPEGLRAGAGVRWRSSGNHAPVGNRAGAGAATAARERHAELIRRGLWHGGAVPWGVQKVRSPEGEFWRLEPDPRTGPVMVEVFRKVARGERPDDVLPWVREQTGETWSREVLLKRLRNPTYQGLLRFRLGDGSGADVVGRWEGLVSVELWSQANRALSTPYIRRGPAREPYLLNEGVAVCAACARPLVGARMSRSRHYVCQARVTRDCTPRVLKADQLEACFRKLATQEFVRRHLRELLASPAGREELGEEVGEHLRSLARRMPALELPQARLLYRQLFVLEVDLERRRARLRLRCSGREIPLPDLPPRSPRGRKPRPRT